MKNIPTNDVAITKVCVEDENRRWFVTRCDCKVVVCWFNYFLIAVGLVSKLRLDLSRRNEQ